jgi:glycosyltransferase 2 family protein
LKKNILNFLIIGISLLILLIFILKTESFDTLYHQLVKLEPSWIIVALLLMFLNWFFEAIALRVIIKFHKIKIKIKDCFSVTMVGQFFNAITPFATGGQPAQVLYMMKNGIETANASSIVMIKFFVFQCILTLYSFIVVLFSFSYFSPRIPLLITMTVLGLSVHASMIVFTLLFSYNRTLTEKIIKLVLRLLKKIRIVKEEVSTEKKIEESLSKFHDNATFLKRNTTLLIKTSSLIFVQLTFYFSIPYCIYRSFGFSSANYFYLFAASVFIITVISIVPLPGSTGGAETGFIWFLGTFFRSNTGLAILIWRIITYYSCIGVGSLFAVVKPKKKKKVKLV